MQIQERANRTKSRCRNRSRRRRRRRISSNRAKGRKKTKISYVGWTTYKCQPEQRGGERDQRKKEKPTQCRKTNSRKQSEAGSGTAGTYPPRSYRTRTCHPSRTETNPGGADMTPPRIIIVPPTGGKQTNQEQSKPQRQSGGSRQKTLETIHPGKVIKVGDADKQNPQQKTEQRRPSDERGENATQTKPNRTDGQHYVTTQNAEYSYEARLAVDNSSNFPLQQKLNIARYCI